MRKIALSILIFVLAGSAYAMDADLSQVGSGARPLGLGKAYTALANDASSIFLNPAGLAMTSNFKFSTMTGKLLDEISYVSAACSNPTRFGTFGIGYIGASTQSIPLTNLITYPTGTFEVQQYDSTDYSSSVLYLSYARKAYSNLSLAGNLKIFSQGFSKDTGAMAGSSGLGMDLDLGAEFKPSKIATFGLMMQNILPQSWGGRFVWKKGNAEEGIPAIIKIGTALKLLGEDGLRSIGNNQLNLSIDSEIHPSLPRPGLWHLGVEWLPFNMLAIRGGLDQQSKAGIVTGVENNFTAGVGLKYKGFSFDYAYHQYGDLSDNTSHFFSIGFLGDEEKPAIDKIRDKVKQLEKNGLNLQVKLKPSILKSFYDVPGGYWAKDAIEYLATLNIFKGYPDSTFHPQEAATKADFSALAVKGREVNLVDPYKPLTRAEGVVIICKYIGLEKLSKVSSNPFPDVPKKYWAAGYIAAAKVNGLLEYLSGKTFEPTIKMSRAEAADILSKVPYIKEQIRTLLINKLAQ